MPIYTTYARLSRDEKDIVIRAARRNGFKNEANFLRHCINSVLIEEGSDEIISERQRGGHNKKVKL